MPIEVVEEGVQHGRGQRGRRGLVSDRRLDEGCRVEAGEEHDRPAVSVVVEQVVPGDVAQRKRKEVHLVGRDGSDAAVTSTAASRLAWVRVAPFGEPVVPLV